MRRIRKILVLFLFVLISIPVGLHITSELIIYSVTQKAQNTELFDVEFITVNDIQWAYREYNPEGEQAIIFVHGFMGSSYDFHLFNTTLSQEIEHRIIAVDLPGFGLSEKSLDYLYTSGNHALELHHFLQTLGIDAYHLVGHSMGGDVVKRHAAQFTDNVLSMTLIAAAGLDTPTERPATPVWFYDFIFTNYFAQRFGVNSATVEPLAREQFHPYIIQNAAIPGEVIRQFSLDQDNIGSLELIEDLEVPTLILYGDKDTWTPPALGQRLNQALPNSQFIVLENVGHLPYLENKIDTLQYFVAFIESI